jgi:hypothetical protein
MSNMQRNPMDRTDRHTYEGPPCTLTRSQFDSRDEWLVHVTWCAFHGTDVAVYDPNVDSDSDYAREMR